MKRLAALTLSLSAAAAATATAIDPHLQRAVTEAIEDEEASLAVAVA